MPEQFKKYPNTWCIIDFTEVFRQKPSDLKSQRELWSTYKALVAISPDVSIVFISKLYGGSSSDKFITKDCGILDYLQPVDSFMADRGFETKYLLKPKRVGLNIAPFGTKDYHYKC